MKIDGVQIKRIYAAGAALGIVGRDREDDLHNMIMRMYGKESIKDLTHTEAAEVLMRLNEQTIPGRITEQQKKKCWALIYKLCKLDPRDAEPNARLAGAVQKILGIPSLAKNPLKWVTFKQAEKLIEYLKRYVRTEEKRNGNRKE